MRIEAMNLETFAQPVRVAGNSAGTKRGAFAPAKQEIGFTAQTLDDSFTAQAFPLGLRPKGGLSSSHPWIGLASVESRQRFACHRRERWAVPRGRRGEEEATPRHRGK